MVPPGATKERQLMPRNPIERKFPYGLTALIAVATAALVLHVASSRSSAEPLATEHGSTGVEPHGLQPLAPTIDHAALSPSAIAVGDAQTVEASIAAYER
jgi:hypothetical protein